MNVLRGFKALTSRFLLTNISYPVDLCPARGPFVSSQFSSFLSTDAWYPAGTIHFVVLYPWATNVWYSDMATRTRSVWPFFTLTNKVCYQTRAGLLARVTLVGNLTDKLLALIWILLVPYLLDSLPTFVYNDGHFVHALVVEVLCEFNILIVTDCWDWYKTTSGGSGINQQANWSRIV